MKFNADKYNRKITLLCPVCGGSEMESIENSEIVKCVGCGNEFTNDELIQENGVGIDVHANEVKEELTKDIQKQFSDILTKAFKGNKNIRIK
ncbi:hypothetical protein OFY73_004777 [Salmonella enterica]|nr:hypothetical protein [Salmonella enterica subsp. enterica serovar Edinburgh]EBH8904655.1 hypothetical protein [Salmonella enterica subsp. enterica serovar 6,7:b:-]EBH8909624.1 hypothetical protein [Salmonella enterica subsp. enterica serovar Santiago]EHG2695535.1 hypothetical protein [Salmonella enterica]EBH8946420.1 hypothetical protein [Salmonella enterica subsp. enterica serovar 6,7:b:-]